jgi:hypothetical protein
VLAPLPLPLPLVLLLTLPLLLVLSLEGFDEVPPLRSRDSRDGVLIVEENACLSACLPACLPA